MASLLWVLLGTEQLGSQIVRRLFGCQCEIRCPVQILEPFPGHVGCSGVTEEQVAGKGEEIQGQQQSEAATHSRLGLLCPGGGWSRSHPVHSFESRAEWGSRRFHLWQGKKPSQITQTTKNSQKGVTVSEISAVTGAPMNRQTDMWAGQMELFVLASERAKAGFAIQFAMYNNTALYTSLTRCCLLQSSIN